MRSAAAECAEIKMADEMKTKISNGEYTIAHNSSSRAKSNVWKAFGVIVDGENN